MTVKRRREGTRYTNIGKPTERNAQRKRDKERKKERGRERDRKRGNTNTSR